MRNNFLRPAAILVTLLLCAVFCHAQKDSIFKDGKFYYCSQPKTDAVRTFLHKDSLRHFYFIWSYNTDTENAWGEDDIKLDHYPTKKEIIEKYAVVDKKWNKSKIKVSIQEVTDEELHQILSPENLGAKQQAAYYRAIYHN